MKWYIIRQASKVVSYLLERISDLKHANEVSKTSPRDATAIILGVCKAMQSHGDKEYIPALKDAAMGYIDRPHRSRAIVESVIMNMLSDKETNDTEEKNPWRKNR